MSSRTVTACRPRQRRRFCNREDMPSEVLHAVQRASTQALEEVLVPVNLAAVQHVGEAEFIREIRRKREFVQRSVAAVGARVDRQPPSYLPQVGVSEFALMVSQPLEHFNRSHGQCAVVCVQDPQRALSGHPRDDVDELGQCSGGAPHRRW